MNKKNAKRTRFHTRVVTSLSIIAMLMATFMVATVGAQDGATPEPPPVTDEPVDDPPAEEPIDEPVGEPPAEDPTQEPVGEPPAEDPTQEPVDDPPADEPTEEPVDDPPADEPTAEDPTQEPGDDPPADEPTEEPVIEPPAEDPTQEPGDDPPADEPIEEPVGEPPVEQRTEEPVIELPLEPKTEINLFAAPMGAQEPIEEPVFVLPAGAGADATLNPAHVGATNPGFRTGSCPTPPAGQKGWYGWHFIMPGNETFLSLSVTFQNAGTISADPFPGVFVAQPDNSHAYIWTSGPDTLLGGTATSSGSQTSFNLSHVCTPYQPLTATKTAAGTYDRSVSWQLTKTVAPGSFSGTAGQSLGDALWTVTATKSETFTNYKVTGNITIANPNGIDVSVSVSDMLDDGTGATVKCPSNIVPANGSLTCTYEAYPGSNAATGNTATITSNTMGVDGTTAWAPVGWTGKLVGDDTVMVGDSRYSGFPQSISSSQTFTYTEPFTCSSNQADYTNGSDYDVYPNTATLTGASTYLEAYAQVEVTCTLPPLVPTKDAAGSYDRTVTWTLDKSVDPASHSGFAGDEFKSTWTVIADKTETLSNFQVTGTITITNPAAIPQTFTISDYLDDDTVASVNCDDVYTVPAGGTVNCTYTAAPTSNAATMNTVEVAAPGNPAQYDYADIGWTETLYGYDEGTLSDERFGYSELISGDTTETFPEMFECPTNPADYGDDGFYSYTVPNTATLNGNIGLSDSAEVVVECRLPALQVSKTAAGTYDRTVEWDLTKSVDPANHSGFAGDEFDSLWTVIATKYEAISNVAVTGTIRIDNPAAIPQTFTISDYLDDDTVASVNCDDGHTVPAGESITCTYTAEPEDASATLNTATVSAPGNAPVAATATIGWTETLYGYDEGTLSDEYLDYEEIISDDTTVTELDTFECSTNPADYGDDGSYSYTVPNTAILNGNLNLSDSATVTVNCTLPALTVEKTAAGSYDRTVTWTLDKSVSPASHSGYAGDEFESTWTVVADKTEILSNVQVTGTITITNPAAIPQTFTISDYLDDDTVASVDCGDVYTVPAGKSITCTYTAEPEDASATLNTATVSAPGNAAVEATAEVSFTENLTGYDEGTLSDPRFGYSESISGDMTETFPESFACSSEPSDYGNDGHYQYTVTNWAYLNGNLNLSDSETVIVDCTLPALQVSKTAAGTYDRTVTWDLTKSVDPASHTGFAGDEFESTWEVIATKTETLDNYQVKGNITITNPAPIAQTFTVSDALDDTTVATVNCDDGYTVPAGESITCTYTALPADGSATLNTATVSAPGNAAVEATAEVSFTENLTGYDEGTLSDPRFGYSELISDDTTETFPEMFECSTNPADYGDDGFYSYTVPNTATLNGNIGLEASAKVTVTCYAPVVSKTADEYFDRHWEWDIEKDYDGSYEMFAGDSVTHNYLVTVTPTSTDNFWGVKGTITIANPNPTEDMTLTGVTDLAGGIAADVTCASLVVPAGGSITCSYDTGGQDALANPFGDLNTATVAFAGANWIGTAPIDFSVATYTESGEPVITVDDTNLTDEAWSADRKPAEWSYTKDFECPTDLSLYVDGKYPFQHVNEAEIVKTGDYDTATVDVNCYALDVSKTAETSFTRTWHWEIEKTVTPDEHDLFTGDSADSLYTVTVTRTGSTDSDWKVFGTITITNPAPIDAELASVTDALDIGSAELAATVDCGVEFPYVLEAGETLTCTYTSDLAGPFGGTNTATATLANGTGFNDSVAFAFGEPALEVNAEVSVTDSNGMAWGPVSETTSWTYTRTFECDADEGEYTNTAQVIGDNDVVLDSDTATVDVTCYALDVSKTVETSFTRTWNWDIEKTVTPDEHDLFTGDSADSLYTVTVTRTGSTDSDWKVFGTITITNPAPIDAELASVADALDIGSAELAATVDCSVEFPYVLEAGETLTCTYSLDVDDASATANRANVRINNTTADGSKKTTQFTSGDVPVDWSEATITEVNAEVSVTDSNGMAWDPVSETTTWTYTRTFECDADEGEYTNTAQVIGDNDVVLDSDTATVDVTCYALDVSKTVETSFTRTWNWEIEKTVTPDEHDLFTGDSANSTYTVTVTRTGYTDSDWKVFGDITITNPAPINAELASVKDILYPGTLFPTVDCGVEFPYTLPAGESLTCTYSLDVDDASATANRANVRINNTTADGSKKTTQFTSGDVPVDWSEATITEVNAEVSVTDSNGMAWDPVSETTTWTYTRTFECDADEGEYTNTAQVIGDNDVVLDSDTATVDVNCYALDVSKTTQTSFTRTWHWEIEKTVTPDEHDLFTGDSANSTYTVTVTRTGSTDSDWKVFGTITITNPAPINAELASVKDILYPGTLFPTVDCGVEFPYTLPAGESLTCTYSLDVDGASATANRANVRINNTTADGSKKTTQFTSGDVTVDWSKATITEVNAAVHVTDSNGMEWGPVSDTTSWTYTGTFECDADEGEHKNTATIVETENSDTATVNVTCYALDVSKTVETSFTRTWNWDITKFPDGEYWMFIGDPAVTHNYAIGVDKVDYTDSDWAVSGTISVYNPAPMGAMINSVSDIVSPDINADVICNVTFPYSLASDKTLTCTYSASLPDATDRTNTATATLQNYHYAADLTATTGTTSFTGSAAVSFAEADVTEVNAAVNVTDDYGTPDDSDDDKSFGPFGEDGSVGYPRDFSCPTAPSLYVDGLYEYSVINTATIDETGDDDSATVTVHCYAPTVSKTADATYTRTWNWTIDKEANATKLSFDPRLDDYAPAEVKYTVTVNATYTDVWEVSGDITVVNPAPMEMVVTLTDVLMVVTLTDVLDDGTPVTITCDPSLDGDQLTIPANTTANCTYIATSMTEITAKLNTATATLNAIDFVATADVEFESVKIDECITVSDTNVDDLRTVCAGNAPQTFTYSLVFGLKWEAPNTEVVEDVELECGFTRHPNAASFVTNDTGATGSDNWTVDITIDCGCTLTQGYWKTHSEFGPAPYDDTWAMLDGASTTFFLSGQSYYEVMQTSPRGNAYYILAPQYIAAKLNILNGAYAPPAVEDAMAQAETLLGMYTPAEVKSNKAVSAKFKMLGDLLDQYNNGYYGPLHCD